MKDAIKLMLIPIIGSIAIGVIFLLVVWAANLESRLDNDEGKFAGMATKDLGEYPTLTTTTNCDNSYFPVCGFDGKTYNNACLAVAAGTKVAHRGACES